MKLYRDESSLQLLNLPKDPYCTQDPFLEKPYLWVGLLTAMSHSQRKTPTS